MTIDLDKIKLNQPESEACKRIKWLLLLVSLISLPAVIGYHVGKSQSTTQGNHKTNSTDRVSIYEGAYDGTYSSNQGQTQDFKIRIERDGSVTGFDGSALGTTVSMRCTGHVIPSTHQITCSGSATQRMFGKYQ